MTKKAGIDYNVCYQTRDLNQDLLLPIMSIKVANGGTVHQFNCLLDTGSQRSYLSRGLLDQMGLCEGLSKCKTYDVNTFLGSVRKSMKEIGLSVILTEGTREILFLVDDDIDMKFCVPGLRDAINNLTEKVVKLAADFSCIKKDTLHVHGLLGVDLLQYLRPMMLINLMGGFPWEVSQGVIPFGNVSHFLLSRQFSDGNGGGSNASSYQNIIIQHSTCPVTHVNFVLSPKSDYLDPCQSFEEASAERKQDMMFSLESLGLREENPISNYDRAKIDSFRDSIVYRDKSYYVELLWDEDKIRAVPANNNVSLKVVDRVVSSVEKKQLYEEYCKVFLEQEKEGIIERCYIEPDLYKDYIWIPHRPVFKTDCQSTTGRILIQPVFNCSFKTGVVLP